MNSRIPNVWVLFLLKIDKFVVGVNVLLTKKTINKPHSINAGFLDKLGKNK